jgi:hypothetical protein
MAELATGIIVTAGSITFVNEWYQTGTVNWRVPVATVLAAGIFDGLAHIDSKAAVGLSIVVLLGALTTEFNGKSASATIAGLFTVATKKPPTVAPRAKAA